MEIELLPVVMTVAGIVLLYGAVTNRNPLDVVKLALQGKDVSAAAPISAPGGTRTGPFTEEIPGEASADPRQLHSDGTPRLFPNGTPRYLDDPNPNSLPDGDPRRRYVPWPEPGTSGDPRPPVDAMRPRGAGISYPQPHVPFNFA